jgi:DNA-binding transcriptional ArsR family regulator
MDITGREGSDSCRARARFTPQKTYQVELNSEIAPQGYPGNARRLVAIGRPLARTVSRTATKVPARVSRQQRDARITPRRPLFGLLANGTRLKLLLALHPRIEPVEVSELTSRCLHDEPDDVSNRELCVCDLAMVAAASQSRTSHQLHLLRQARLVEFRRTGKHALYRLSDGPHAHLLLDALEYVRSAKMTVCDSSVESDG